MFFKNVLKKPGVIASPEIMTQSKLLYYVIIIITLL